MTHPRRWRDTRHRERAVETAGSTVLLVAGDKSGRWNRWYRTAIPEAERLYENYRDARKRKTDMTEPRHWRDSGHLDRAVETAGGQEAFDAAVG
jgi:hypothetical protein